MQSVKNLIINADDYGGNHSNGTSSAILLAHKYGIVTSTTVLIKYVTQKQIQNIDNFNVPAGLHVMDDPESELEEFVKLFGRLPTHMDSHRWKMYLPEYRENFYRVAKINNLPIRRAAIPIPSEGVFSVLPSAIEMPPNVRTTDYMIMPEFDSPDSLVAILPFIKNGTTEIVCHPTIDGGTPKKNYGERQFMALIHPEVRQTISKLGINLISFADLD